MKLKLTLILLITSFLTGCSVSQKVKQSHQNAVDQLLDQWHRDVATFDFDAYFGKLTDDAVFIGTDATEVWDKQQFMAFSKPYFDQQKTWDFKPLQRHVYWDKTGKTAWFDEVLDTWMGLCRGSGVITLTDKGWKINHYVLSVTVPNDAVKKVIEAKQNIEKEQLKSFTKEK